MPPLVRALPASTINQGLVSPEPLLTNVPPTSPLPPPTNTETPQKAPPLPPVRIVPEGFAQAHEQLSQAQTQAQSVAPNIANPAPQAAPAAPTNTYSSGVEQWRSLAQQTMPVSLASRPDAATLLDKFLYVMQGESGGNATATHDGGNGYGLMGDRIYRTPVGTPPDQQLRNAWALVANNPNQWTDWGEGVLYQGRPFGALGVNPYSGAVSAAGQAASSAARTVARALPSAGASATLTRPSPFPEIEPLARPATSARGFAEDSATGDFDRPDIPEIDAVEDVRASAVLQSYPSDVARAETEEYLTQLHHNLAEAEGKGENARRHAFNEAFRSLRNRLMDYYGGGGSLVGPLAMDFDPSKPLDWLQAVGAPFELAGEGLASVADVGSEQVFGRKLPRALRRLIELSPDFTIGVGKFSLKSILTALGFSVGGGEAARAAIGPQSQWIGELVGPVLGPAGLAAITRRQPGPVVRIGPDEPNVPRDDLELRPPEEPAKPLPGQMDIFGNVVDDTGNLRPGRRTDPEAPEFRGEQGGQEPSLFTADELAGTSETFQPRIDEPRPDATTAPRSELPEGGEIVGQLEPVRGIARDRRRINVDDIETAPEIFQARDAPPGQAVDTTRVNQIVRAWDDAQFTPPEVVPHPTKPGKWIVYAGHHRTEAFRDVKGAGSPIEVVAAHADITDPVQRDIIAGVADASNAATAPLNFRERLRAVQRGIDRGQGSGQTYEEALNDVAASQRITPDAADRLMDAARLGDGAVDRVVLQPELGDYASAIGRAMRVYEMTLEDANGLFNQIADTSKRHRPTMAALGDTLDRFAAAYQRIQQAKLQGALFDTAQFEGFEGGFLGMLGDYAKTTTQLQSQMRSVRRAQNAASRLAEGGDVADRAAAQRLVDLGQKEQDRLSQLLEAMDENITRLSRGEEPIPLPDGNASAPRPRPELPEDLKGAKPRYRGDQVAFESDLDLAAYIAASSSKNRRFDDYLQFVTENTGWGENTAKRYGSHVRRQIASVEPVDGVRTVPDQGAELPPPPGSGSAGGGAATPPAAPRIPKIGDEPIDQLVGYVEAAGAMRPELLVRRREELSRRLRRATQRLADEGVPPDEAFARARRELRGQLADPAFDMPGNLDTNTLFEEIRRAVNSGDLEGLRTPAFFIGNNANEGLQKLSVGVIPAPHEVEALGLIFGPRLQYAIEQLGDVFKVQRRVEQLIQRTDVNITWANGSALSPENLAEALAMNLPDANQGHVLRAAERLIDEDLVDVGITKSGKARVRFKRSEQDALGRAAHDAMFERSGDVPEQVIPPTQPRADEDFQPSLAQGEGEITRGSAQFDLGTSPDASPSLNQQRLNRSLEETIARRGAADPRAGEPPRRPPTDSDQFAFEGGQWRPAGQSLTDRIFGTFRNITALPKGLMATLDRSAVIRQGGLMIRHGEQVQDAIRKTMIIADDAADAARLKQQLGLPDSWEIPNAEDVMSAVNHGKWSQVRRDAGLVVEEWGRGARLEKRNEDFMSDLLEKIMPGAKMANRSFVVYLNKLRADVFDSIMEKWAREGHLVTQRDVEGLAQYINAATGRGNLGQLEGAARMLSQTFFSPRNLVSRFQVLGQFVAPNTPYLVRKEIAKDLAVYVGIGISILSLAELSGMADVNLDPRSSDFGKMRIGNTRIDIWGGYQQIARYTTQLITGEAKAATGTVFGVDRATVAGRFLLSKLAPSTGFGVDVLFDTDLRGDQVKPFSSQSLFEMVTPLFVQDVIEAVEENGGKGLLYAPAAFFGGAVQTYISPSEERMKARNKVAQEKWGVDWDELPARFPSTGFSKQAEIDAMDEVAPKIEAAREAARDLPFGREQEARQQMKEELNERILAAEDDFRQGTLLKPLPEIWSDIGKEAAGARRQHELDFPSDFDKDDFDNALTGYYDQTVFQSGVIDWDATILAQEEYLDGLPREQRQQIEDFLGVQQRKKSELWQEYRGYLDLKEQAGYFREGITQAERDALDRANPELDVQGWYFRGGVEGANPPKLQTAEAVEMALAMNLPNRDVAIDSLVRPINENEQTLAAWQYSKGPVQEFLFEAVDKFKEQEAARLYKKPYDQLIDDEQRAVASNIRTSLRRGNPELDAWLVWWGYSEALQSRAAGQIFVQILDAYGSSPPKEGFEARFAKNAR